MTDDDLANLWEKLIENQGKTIDATNRIANQMSLMLDTMRSIGSALRDIQAALEQRE